MARTKFTAVTMKMKAPESGRVEMWDSLLPGFGARLGKGGGAWFVMYRVTETQDGATKRVQKRYSFGSWARWPEVGPARDEARRILRLVEAGIDPALARDAEPVAPPPPLTISRLVSLYIEKWAKPRNRTAHVIEQQLRKHVVPVLGDRPAEAVTKVEIEAIRDRMTAAGHDVQANRVLAMVKRLYVWAGEEGLLTVDPAKSVRATGVEIIRDRVLSDHEMGLILRAAGTLGGANGPLVMLLAFTGQRRGEIAKMRWADLDLNYEIQIADENASTHKDTKLSALACPMLKLSPEQTKARRTHLLPIPYAAMPLIMQQPRNCEYVLSNDGKNPISGFSKLKRKLDKQIAEFALQDGGARTIKPWHIHDLRRTLASKLDELRIREQVISAILNHAPLGVTSKHYVHTQRLEEKLDALNTYAQHLQIIMRRG